MECLVTSLLNNQMKVNVIINGGDIWFAKGKFCAKSKETDCEKFMDMKFFIFQMKYLVNVE